MMQAIDRESGYCNACFTGRYPIEVNDAQGKLNFEGVLA
jgi:amidophosphoribosyltransferase